MDFYERFIKLCNDKNVKPSPMLESIGIQKTAATNWKKRKSKPTYANLQKLADYFGVSVEYLKGETENPSAESGKGEKTFTVGAFEEKNGKGIETVNVNMNTLAYVTELVESVKGLSIENIQLLINVAKKMK